MEVRTCPGRCDVWRRDGPSPVAGSAGKSHQPIATPPNAFDPSAADFGPQEVGNELAGPIAQVDDVADRPNEFADAAFSADRLKGEKERVPDG